MSASGSKTDCRPDLWRYMAIMTIEKGNSAGLFSAATYEELAVDLECAIEWIERFEIVVDRTRVGRYRRLLAEVVELQDSGDASQENSRFHQYVNALFALHELALVHRSFVDRGHDDFVRGRMGSVTAGPISYTEEVPSSSSNLARNIEFELILAGHCVSGGLQLTPSLVSDVTLQVADRVVLLECKRPQSQKGLVRAISDAKDQLMRSYFSLAGHSFRGVVAIDVTKVVNPSFEILRASTLEEVNLRMVKALVNLLTRNNRTLQRLFYRKTLGLILRFSAMAEVGLNETNLMYCQHYAVAELDLAGQNLEVFRRLRDGLDRGIRACTPFQS